MKKTGAHIALYLCIFLAGTLLFSAVPVKAKKSTGVPQLILLCIDSLTIQDVTGGRLPHVKEAFNLGACALLNTNVAGGTNLDSAYLTLGTGVRAKVVERQPGYMWNEDFPTEEGLALEVKDRRTGNSTGAVLQPGIAALTNANRGLGYSVQLGVLGTALREADYTTAVIGCADTDRRERPLVNLLMDANGSVPYGYIGTDLFLRDPNGPFGFWTSSDAIISEVRKYKKRVNVMAIEWADLYRAEKYALYCDPIQATKMREEALERLDKFIAIMMAEFSSKESLVMILSPFPGMDGSVRRQRLTPVALWGPNVKSGYLISPTTRRQGLIANIDITAGILTHFRLPISKAIIGRPFIAVPAERTLDDLRLLDQRVTNNYVQRPLVLRLFILYLIVTLALSMLAALLHNYLLGCLVHRLLLAGVTLPLVFLILPLLPPLSLGRTLVLTVVLAILPAVAAFNPISSHEILFFTAVATVLALAIDVITGQKLVSSSLLGYCFISGARYYGIGNEYMGVFIGAFFVVIGSILEQLRLKTKLARFVMLMSAVVGSYFLGAGWLGANAGGTLSFAVGAWAAYLWLADSGLQKEKLVRSIIMGGIILLVLALADWSLLNNSSHIGQAIDQARQLGTQVIIGILQRKVSMNLKLLRYSLWSRVLLMLILAISVVFFGPYRHSLRLQRDNPLLIACLRGAIIAAILALIANDSGVVAAATALLFPSALLILLSLPFSDKRTSK